MRIFIPLAALGVVLAAPAQAQTTPAYAIVADLTTDVGARLGGTAREALAREWAAARLKALGFANVRIEPFAMPGWERGAESAEITGAASQKLAIAALGNSGATPPGGITAPLAYFPGLAALQAAPAGSLKGKIAFIDHAMTATQDGSSYGPFGEARRKGPAYAAAKGAAAVLIRSVGTDHARTPHTGMTGWPAGMAPIPAAAVSVPDALLIARRAGRGDTVHLVLTPRFTGEVQSGNVLAELPGTRPDLPPILLACHLDSWDLATGAIDDGAGCAIITAAALQARAKAPLARTIRVLWAGTEERGGFGGAAYAKAHATEPPALVMESDTGADRVYRASFAGLDKALVGRLAAVLAPYGVAGAAGEAQGGEDVGFIAEAQHTPVIDLHQDMTRYFDWHHTPDDTLDKIDPAQLQQNVDVWAAVLGVVADAEKLTP